MLQATVRRVGSVRLTLALLIALAAFGAAGTFLPQGLPDTEYVRRYPNTARLVLGLGFDGYYTGPLYRGLLLCLTLNLLACSLGRSLNGLRDTYGHGNRFQTVPCETSPDRLRARLRGAGFRVRGGTRLRAMRHPWAFLGFPLVHLAPLGILAGALWGSLGGYVGTQTLSVGGVADSFYNWSVEAERELPFALHLDELSLLHYPIELRIEAAFPHGETTLLQGRLGQELPVPNSPFRVRLLDFDPAREDLTFLVADSARSYGPYSRATAAEAPLRIQPVAFRDPEVRAAVAHLSLWSNTGDLLDRVEVAVNRPLIRDGIRVFLTAWGTDASDTPFAGLQFVHDPGQTPMWCGAVLTTVGLLLLLLTEGAWVRQEGDELLYRCSRRGRWAEQIRRFARDP